MHHQENTMLNMSNMQANDISRPITFGIRGEKFKIFIASLLRKGHVAEKYVSYLLTKESMDLYAQAFTNPSADPICNYEFLEFMGDTTCNKSVKHYILCKFPKLTTKSQGLMIASRLFHILQSTETFSKIALSLGFEKFISVGWERVKDTYEDVMKMKRNSVLEDVFEAFFGATEQIVDKMTKEGVGYAICNSIFKGFVADYPLPSLKYEDLFDPITRLKELFDFNFPERPGLRGGRLGKIEYVDGDKVGDLKNVNIMWTDQDKKSFIIGSGSGSLKEKAKAVAARQALENLKKHGYSKDVPYNYQDFI